MTFIALKNVYVCLDNVLKIFNEPGKPVVVMYVNGMEEVFEGHEATKLIDYVSRKSV